MTNETPPIIEKAIKNGGVWIYFVQTITLLGVGIWTAAQISSDVDANKKDVLELRSEMYRFATEQSVNNLVDRVDELASKEDLEIIKGDIREIRSMIFDVTRRSSGPVPWEKNP